MSTTFSVQPNIYGYTIPALEQYLCSIGEKPTKAPYIFRGLYRHRVTSLTDIPDLRHSLLERMQADFCMKLPKLLEQITTEDTVKFLFSMEDLLTNQYNFLLCLSLVTSLLNFHIFLLYFHIYIFSTKNNNFNNTFY